MAKTLTRIKKVEIIYIEEGKEKKEIITVQKAPLGKWKRLTDSIKRLFELLPEILKKKGIENPEEYIEKIEIQDLLLLIPDMLEVAADEMVSVLAIGTDLEGEYIEEKVGLDEAIDLFEAIIAVNNLIKVVEKGKNLMNLWRTISPQRK